MFFFCSLKVVSAAQLEQLKAYEQEDLQEIKELDAEMEKLVGPHGEVDLSDPANLSDDVLNRLGLLTRMGSRQRDLKTRIGKQEEEEEE